MYPLYRVLEGTGKLNVGATISYNILRRTMERVAPLCYPGLIQQLCIAAGVDMTQFRAPGSRMFDLGSPIPVPDIAPAPSLTLFTPLECFERDEGTYAPAPPRRPSAPDPAQPTATAPTAAAPAKKSRPPRKAAKTIAAPIILETVQETEPAVRSPPATVQEEQSEQQTVPPQPTPQPTTAVAGTSSSSAPVTMDVLLEMFRQREEAEARRREEEEKRREERKKEKEEERRLQELDRERRREEKRKEREEENRRREDDALRREERLMKQFQDSQQSLIQSLMGMFQQAALPPPPAATVPAALALPVQPHPSDSGQTPAGTTSGSEQPSHPDQSHPAGDSTQGNT